MKISVNTFATLKSELYFIEDVKFNFFSQIPQDGKSMSPLMAAAANASYTTLQSLLDAGADFNAKDKLGDTALIYLCREDKIALQDFESKILTRQKRQHCFDELISQGADLDVKGSEGMTALMHCARKGNCKFIDTLLLKVVDVKARCDKGLTALMYASFYNDHFDEVCLNRLIHESDINVTDSEGITPLLHSIDKNNVKFFTSLIGHNPDINIQNNLGINAVMLASYAKTEDYLSILLKLNPQLNNKDRDGNTALMRSAMNKQDNDHKCAKLLIAEEIIDLNAQNNEGETALKKATQIGKEELVKILTAAGANVNLRNNNGKTALKHARLIPPSRNGNTNNIIRNVIINLIEAGAEE